MYNIVTRTETPVNTHTLTKELIMLQIKNSLKGLVNKLYATKGMNETRTIMSSSYGRNLSEQEVYALVKQDNQAKAEHPADIKPKLNELEFDLKYLRAKWLQLSKSIAGVDGRTALSKRTRAMMLDIVADGESIKQQMEVA